MIHYLTISRDSGEPTRLTNNDGSEACAHDGIQSVELTVEQHYGIRVHDDENGRTWIEVREGGSWSTPVPVQDLVRTHRAGQSKD